jgi:hypothetical protein
VCGGVQPQQITLNTNRQGPKLSDTINRKPLTSNSKLSFIFAALQKSLF